MKDNGFIQAPTESAECFKKRKKYCLKQKPEISHPKYSWLPITYSDDKLSFFEGGATWIEEVEPGVFIPSIQLRRCFLEKNSYMGYSKKEILDHETVHALRAAFDDDRFEEIVAYSTSPNFLRRYFGPMFRSTRSGYIFIGLTLASLGLQYFSQLFTLFPLLYFLYLLCKLIRDQYLFNRTFR